MEGLRKPHFSEEKRGFCFGNINGVFFLSLARFARVRRGRRERRIYFFETANKHRDWVQ